MAAGASRGAAAPVAVAAVTDSSRILPAGATALRAVSAPGRIRTCDARFRKPTLYPLSYGGGGQSATQSAGLGNGAVS